MARVQKRPCTSSDNNDIAHPLRESSPQNNRLGARSCRGCHQRKVRCDRGVPCTNCSRCGITCMYPSKDRDVARKSPSLQDISDRLERLEILLSRFSESSQVTTGSAGDRGGSDGESQTQIQVQSCANVNATGTANQLPSFQRHCKSTWELLLNDEQVVRHANHSNIETLLRDVRLDFLDFIPVLLPSIIHYPGQANMTHPPGTKNQNYSNYWLGNSIFASSEQNKCSLYNSCATACLCSFRHGF